MQINGMNPLFGTQHVNPSVQTQSTTSAHSVSESKNANSVQDEVRLNNAPASDVNGVSASHCVEDTSDIRLDLVNRIRAEIAAGTYETEEKLDIALSRMLNAIQNN